MFQQNEKTTDMFLSTQQEAECILADIFDEDQEAQSSAISELYASQQFSSEEEMFNYIIENEDFLYEKYLPTLVEHE
jgi:hypothetical protein